MHSILTLLIIVLLSICSHVGAEVRSSNSMHEILKNADEETLVIFDLDNTLIFTGISLGTDKWFDYYSSTRSQAGVDPELARKQANRIVSAVYSISAKPVEPSTPAEVSSLQTRGIRVIGLTARWPVLGDATVMHIHHAGYDLTRSSIPGEFYFSQEPGMQYRDGIIFMKDRAAKGDALRQFLHDLGWKPKKILFIDDKLKHVRSVDEASTELGIEVLSYRYGGADFRVDQFDDAVVEYQLGIFEKEGRLVTDEEALELLKLSPCAGSFITPS